jgi:bifunctional non-homologous end joining protein LigD
VSITQSPAARRAALGTPGWLEPELATLTKDRFSDPAWFYERKLDGERCLAYRSGHEVLLMTRNRQDVSRTYPEVRDALAAQSTPEFVCDGEVVAFDGAATKFSRLQQRLGVRDPDAELIRRVPVFYYVFDLLYADGRDVRPEPLHERKKLLCQALSFRDPLRYAEHRDRDGEEYFEQACRQGWEGLIAKRADAPYRSGRTRDWLKFKCENGQEFLIGGYTDPRGARTHFGALLLGYYTDEHKLPGPLARGDRAGRPALRPEPDAARRRPAAIRRPLGRAASGRPDRFHRVDGGRTAQASALSGTAPG